MTFRVRTAGTAVRCALLLVASVLTTWTATSIMAAPASAAPVVCQKSYTDLKPSEIQAGAADTSIDMTVPDDYEVADVDVQVDITHPNDGEVDLTIGRGSLQYLTNSNGGTGDDFADTIFDDEAAVAIAVGTAPFAGRYRPTDPLSSFDGVSAKGTWSIMAKDTSTGPGTLNYWRLILTFVTCDLDGDAVEDHGDNCLGLANPGQTDTDGDGRGDACDGNDDNDALVDSLDACDRLAAATASGCPRRSRTISLHFGSGRFYGRLASPLTGCVSHRPVAVWRVRVGADRRLGTVTSRSDGAFSLTARRRAGTYYAVTPRVVVPNKGECAKTTSPRLTLG
jgi:subtilisin-like proprotein convertase family protein